MLLYDELIDHMTAGLHNTDYSDEYLLDGFRIEDYIKDCIVFGINNVVKYLFDSRSTLVIKDLPNIAPPYPYMWFEYTLNQKKIGILTRSCRADGYSIDDANGIIYPNGGLPLVSDFDTRGMMFYTEAIIIIKDSHAYCFSPNCIFTMVCDEYGSPIISRTTIDSRQKELASTYWSLFTPSALAISFMHCKNVKTVSNYPPRQISRNGQPRAKYYTLQIAPMKKILEHEGGSNKTGLKLALHICRGHFKDYSGGDGLFGKYKGLYWWDSQVRGTSSRGVVVKDYSIKPASDSEQGGCA